jgi:hypothetical protein
MRALLALLSRHHHHKMRALLALLQANSTEKCWYCFNISVHVTSVSLSVSHKKKTWKHLWRKASLD